MSKELKLLFPEKEVELAGQTFTIRPFSFVETRTVVRKLKDALHLFSGELTVNALADIYDKAFDGIVDVIAMVYQLDRETVEQFDNKTALQAVMGIVEVNKDFFVEEVERLIPVVMQEQVKPQKKGR